MGGVFMIPDMGYSDDPAFETDEPIGGVSPGTR